MIRSAISKIVTSQSVPILPESVKLAPNALVSPSSSSTIPFLSSSRVSANFVGMWQICWTETINVRRWDLRGGNTSDDNPQQTTIIGAGWWYNGDIPTMIWDGDWWYTNHDKSPSEMDSCPSLHRCILVKFDMSYVQYVRCMCRQCLAICHSKPYVSHMNGGFHARRVKTRLIDGGKEVGLARVINKVISIGIIRTWFDLTLSYALFGFILSCNHPLQSMHSLSWIIRYSMGLWFVNQCPSTI